MTDLPPEHRRAVSQQRGQEWQQAFQATLDKKWEESQSSSKHESSRNVRRTRFYLTDEDVLLAVRPDTNGFFRQTVVLTNITSRLPSVEPSSREVTADEARSVLIHEYGKTPAEASRLLSKTQKQARSRHPLVDKFLDRFSGIWGFLMVCVAVALVPGALSLLGQVGDSLLNLPEPVRYSGSVAAATYFYFGVIRKRR
jgi:hypothetical protein